MTTATTALFRLGRYAVDAVQREEPLGRLLRARLPELERGVWIAELCPPAALTPDERDAWSTRFEEDARRLMDIGDPRVLRPCDLARSDDGCLFLVFDRADTAEFGALPADAGRLEPEEWIDAAAAACEMLQAVRDAGVDVTLLQLENLLRSDSGELRYLPVHFAHLSRVYAAPTEAISSPEERSGGLPSATALVFAVGAWLYGCLADRLAEQLADDCLRGIPPEPLTAIRASIRPAVSAALETALRLDPAERFESLRDLAEALEPRGRPWIGTPADAAEPSAWKGAVAARWAVTAAIALAALGLLFGWAAAQLFPLP